MTYASQHLPYTATAKNVSYHIEALDQWWGDKRLSDVTAGNCRAYAKTRRRQQPRAVIWKHCEPQ